jgi:hypothetical protein
VKLADIRSDSWFQLVSAIKRGEHPKHRLLAAALRRGEDVPPAAQDYLAKIVERPRSGSLTRGRPRKPLYTAEGNLWGQVVRAIERRERWNRLMAEALRRGEKVPPEAQVVLAEMVETARALARGRPPSPKRKGKDKYNIREDLLLQERDLIAKLREEGVSKPAQQADEQLGSKHELEPETVERQANIAARHLALADAGFALRIHNYREVLARDGVDDAVTVALHSAAAEFGVALGVVQRWYDRGKTYLKRHVDDPPVFK